MRLAIVGAGISGLTCASLLHPHHDITIFEASGHVGGHTHTVPVETASGRWAVDTGFIVYNERNYPHFAALLSQLGVATQPSSMSFSVRADRSDLEYNGSTLHQLYGQRRNLLRPSFHRMVLDILRFNRSAARAAREDRTGISLGDWLAGETYSAAFVDHYLVPMTASIWSQPRDRALAMPLGFVVRFFENHGMLTVDDRPAWRVVRGGSARYVEALTAPFAGRIRLRAPARDVRRERNRVLVNGEPFDEVILACHSDQARAALADASPAEEEILGAIPFQANEVVLHTDTRLLPRRRALWAAWNYHVADDPGAPVTLTYCMNILQALDAPETFCVTLNRAEEIDPARVLARLTYHHPAFSAAGVAAQARHAEISGVNRTHYCGAYWGSGFHEDGVKSALAVCRRFGAAP